MINIKKFNEVKIGDEAQVVYYSKCYEAYSDESHRYYNKTGIVSYIHGMQHIRLRFGTRDHYFPISFLNFEGDTKFTDFDKIKNGMLVLIGKELHNLDYNRIMRLLSFKFLNQELNSFYNKKAIVLDKFSIDNEKFVKLKIERNIIFLPPCCLFQLSVDYSPRKLLLNDQEIKRY